MSCAELLPDRFWAKIEVNEHTGCWEWTGAKVRNGYGVYTVPGDRMWRVHRLTYARFRGSIPSGLVIDHLCRVRHCANPEHLEVVTPRTNLMRGDTLAAQNASKTSCIHGHEFTLDNTYVTKAGQRYCRECMRAAKRRYEQRKKEAAR